MQGKHGDQTLQAFFADFYAPLALRSRTKNTRRLYATTIRNLERFLQRRASLEDLNDLTVNRFLTWFRCLPRSAWTTNKERANLLAIWRFACRKQFLQVWPDVALESQPERVPQAWTQDQLARLFAAAAEEPGVIGGAMARHWWTALLLVSWDTGERIGAVRDLEWRHVDLASGWLLVPAELRKGKRRDRSYRLASDTVAQLKKIYHPQRQNIFPWDDDRNSIWRRFGRILKRAGLPADRRSKFHRIRRSVASHFEAAGGNATELLDHAKRATTLAYLDPRIVPKVQAIDLLFRPQPRPADGALQDGE